MLWDAGVVEGGGGGGGGGGGWRGVDQPREVGLCNWVEHWSCFGRWLVLFAFFFVGSAFKHEKSLIYKTIF